MNRLVSVIIPCFNAERWIAEAIDSCFAQTYPRVEVIVIDDGSTDRSAEILARYDQRIIWQSGPNRGGNHARNLGFKLSSGDYIQYLDADDYLLPEKLERQVKALDEDHADLVYSDWRYKYHTPDGGEFLDDIHISGPKPDLLEAVLVDRWVAPVALLFTRDAVFRSQGWDESLRAAQDRDFLISVLINGAKAAYSPGCYSIYRRHGDNTVSTSNHEVWIASHWQLMEKAEANLRRLKKLSPVYRLALARSYLSKWKYMFAKIGVGEYPRLIRRIIRVLPA
jgi:glycosyltransferase involved in cell wall biosynthesis